MSLSEDDTITFTAPADEIDKYLAAPPVPVEVRFGAVSHPGKVRQNNEDRYLVVRRRREREVLLTNAALRAPESCDLAYALLVADGVGGAAFGELASNLALQTAWEWGRLTTSWVMLLNQHEAEKLEQRANAFVNMLHRALNRRAATDPDLRGMGATLTVAYSMGLDAAIIHVGDSRAYLLRGGGIQRLTRDHTLAAELTELGIPAAATRGYRHVLTNSLGCGAEEVKTEFHLLPLADGDRLLLCSDGLSDLVSDKEIAAAAARHTDPQEACQALLERALERGGKDNITIVLAQYALAPTS